MFSKEPYLGPQALDISVTTPPTSSSSSWSSVREIALIEAIKSLSSVNHTPQSISALIEDTVARARNTGGRLRIGVYDGSFDPPHFGHVEVAHVAKAFARLDLLVILCHPKPNYLKPHLSPHSIRTEMLSSYFLDSKGIIVSPVSREETETLIRPNRIVGIIGSDTFNRFLRDGIAPNFTTDEIFVAERTTDLLYEAPHELHGRPVLYAGAAALSFNQDSSSVVRKSLPSTLGRDPHPLLNEVTNALIQHHNLYKDSPPYSTGPRRLERHPIQLDERAIPLQYSGCAVTKRLGLHNGLLSESYVHEVRNKEGELLAFMKQVPLHRNPHVMISDEGAGLSIFNSLGCMNAKAPPYIITQNPPSLWVERAPGVTLSSLITGYDRGEESEQRVYDALEAVGRLLGSLHRRHQQPFNQSAINLLRGHIAHHEELLAQASPEQEGNLELEEFARVFRNEASTLIQEGIQCSLLHGDANPGNFLWEESSRSLSVIDLQRLGAQIRTAGTGFSTLEFFSFMRTLYHFPNIGFEGRRGGLREAIATFRDAYGPVNLREEEMFNAMWCIRKILAGNVRIHGIPPKEE